MSRLTEAGRVGYWRQVITVAPTITAGLYAANDALGGRMTFSSASIGAGQSGMIEAVRIVDRAVQLAPMDLVLFDQAFTATADNDPFDPSDADMESCVGVIPVTAANYWQFFDNAVAVVYPVGLPFVTVGSGDLYGQLVVRAAPTYVATTDIRVRLTVRRD